jgi:hypothetical protein
MHRREFISRTIAGAAAALAGCIDTSESKCGAKAHGATADCSGCEKCRELNQLAESYLNTEYNEAKAKELEAALRPELHTGAEECLYGCWANHRFFEEMDYDIDSNFCRGKLTTDVNIHHVPVSLVDTTIIVGDVHEA